MEDWINVDYKNIIKVIKQLNSSHQYAACTTFLDLIRPYFCKYIIPADDMLLYRVRSHTQGTGKYFFNNISELSFRSDFFNISNFGRCNCPYESVFYCSDSALLSLIEVSELYRKKTKKDAVYHTLSVWKITQPLNVTPIFQTRDVQHFNKRLAIRTEGCLKMIDEFGNYSKKAELKEFHNIIGQEFIKPFSVDDRIYLFSSAIAHYLLNKNERGEYVDGIVYPTCIDMSEIKNFGLNYVFNPLVIGFDKKIELKAVYRSKMQKKGDAFSEIERVKFKKANKVTGEIKW